MNSAAGHLKPSDWRGRVFSLQAIASSASCVKPLKSLSFGQVLPQQAGSVLVDAALPGAVRISEGHRHSGVVCQLLMRRHFPALIVR